ncbi:hypothetical protein Taro_051200 [Colocasia esculenta]|uniref:Uncharacterized protein n=1 Tax=Colocasia esculenta TaxID=4460 RepID=A0A843XG24_COLES|nr:hypothetical protein [Colocasia esculenta]
MHGATNCHHDRPATNSCDSESLPGKSRGGEPREQGSIRITSPLPARAAQTPTSGSKITQQSSKVRNTYCRVLQSSGNRETPRPQPESGQRRLPQNQQTTQCGSKPSAHTHRDKKAHGTSERPRETRVSRHKHPTSQTSTWSGRNNQVSPRETPNNHVRSNVSPQARPPQTSTRSRVHKQNQPAPRTLHEVRELHLPVSPRTAPRNGLLNQRSGAYTRHPERTCRAETTKHGPQGQTNQTKGSETWLGYNHRVNQGNKNTSSKTTCEAMSQQELPSHRHRRRRGGHTVHTSSTPAADSRL